MEGLIKGGSKGGRGRGGEGGRDGLREGEGGRGDGEGGREGGVHVYNGQSMDQPDAQHVQTERTSRLVHFQGYSVPLAEFSSDSVETDRPERRTFSMDGLYCNCINFRHR